jgi:hemerythrin-like metal-binding protein
MSVGSVTIDNQHKQLIALINKLGEAMQQGRGNDVMNEVLSELTDYTIKHFRYEESIFSASRYPHSELHKQKHTVLVDQVKSIRAKMESGQSAVSTSTFNFLKDWITEHIMKTDMTYTSYI